MEAPLEDDHVAAARRLAVPATMEYYDMFGAAHRSLHCELLHREHMRFLQPMGITFYDPGVNQYLSPEVIRAHTDVPFQWRYRCTEVAFWTPQQVKENYRRAARQGASRLYMEVMPETPLENVEAYKDLREEVEEGEAWG